MFFTSLSNSIAIPRPGLGWMVTSTSLDSRVPAMAAFCSIMTSFFSAVDKKAGPTRPAFAVLISLTGSGRKAAFRRR